VTRQKKGTSSIFKLDTEVCLNEDLSQQPANRRCGGQRL